MRGLLGGILVLGFAATASAQADVIDGLDVLMESVRGPRAMGREGTYPNGVNGIAFDSTICNSGTVGVKWKGPMKENHPFLCFLVARESNGRFEQISDRSFIKHTFASSNSSICSTCTDTSDSSVMAVGCSDTYDAGSNGDRYWLGPPEELDPWLGDWEADCSYLDHGDPRQPPPDDCDGVRSLTFSQIAAFDNVKNRCQVSDADLGVAGATYYAGAAYLVRGEADDLRADSYGFRELVPTWNGSMWDFTFTNGMRRGSILRNWNGAVLHSNSNGADDGRVYIAHLVTGPDGNGNYHYEYAIHNRDNSRGISSFRLPVVPGALVTNVGFRDLDVDPANDWTFTQRTAEVEWATTTNPLEWNTFFNFWFDADVAPADGMRALVSEFRPGTGFDRFDIATTAPSGPSIGNRLGFGMAGGDGVFPDLSMTGSLDVGQSVHIVVRYAAPNSFALGFLGTANTGLAYRGGTILPYPPDWIFPVVTDAEGQLLATATGMGGTLDFFLQLAVADASAPQAVELSEALEIIH